MPCTPISGLYCASAIWYDLCVPKTPEKKATDLVFLSTYEVVLDSQSCVQICDWVLEVPHLYEMFRTGVVHQVFQFDVWVRTESMLNFLRRSASVYRLGGWISVRNIRLPGDTLKQLSVNHCQISYRCTQNTGHIQVLIKPFLKSRLSFSCSNSAQSYFPSFYL